MQIVAFDTETALILPGLRTPPMTCLSYVIDGTDLGDVVDRHQGRELLRGWLRDPSVKLIAHNVAFDAAVTAAEWPELLPLWFRAYEEGRVEDTLIREQLIDIAEGHFLWEVDPLTDEVIRRKRYGLGSLFSDLDKKTWRLGYGKLRDVPVSQWAEGAFKYALEDAVACLKLYKDQERRYGKVVDSEAQARAAFALHLMSTWGMRTDEQVVGHLEKSLDREVTAFQYELIEAGLLREDSSRDMAAIRKRLAESGVTLTYTPTGQISTSSDSLKDTHDPVLEQLVEYAELLKLQRTYLPVLQDGLRVPINANFNVLVNSGRTSCSRPNLQNLPRGKKGKDGKWIGHAHLIREAFIPRPGTYFSFCDYDSLEVRTFGQVLHDLVGGTTLSEAYNKDPDFDPHTSFAALQMGIEYGEAMARKKRKDVEILNARQMMKAFVFGAPGGMGYRKMCVYAKKSYGVDIDPAQSQILMQRYRQWLPEVQRYFDGISAATSTGSANIEQVRSKRVRGKVGYTDCCNGFFQGLAADLAKAALWEVTKRCYTVSSSNLYGSRPVCFIHDEIGLEVPIGHSHEAAMEQEQVMTQVAEQWTPNVPSRASPALMKRWYKGADRAYDANKRLVPWEPK